MGTRWQWTTVDQASSKHGAAMRCFTVALNIGIGLDGVGVARSGQIRSSGQPGFSERRGRNLLLLWPPSPLQFQLPSCLDHHAPPYLGSRVSQRSHRLICNWKIMAGRRQLD